MFPVGVLHFPLRSFEQYRKKIQIADHNRFWSAARRLERFTKPTSTGRLEDVYEKLLLDEEALAPGPCRRMAR